MKRMLALLVVASSCRSEMPAPVPAPPPPPPVPAAAAAPAARLVSLELGRVTGKAREGRDVTATFGPRDILYVAVAAEGVTRPTPVTTRWIFGEKLLHEESQDLPAGDSARTEFHIKKASGWEPGAYRVEVLLDGRPAGTKEFSVAPAAGSAD